MQRVQVRVKDEVLTRWSEAAERRGVSVSEMVREIVEGDLDGRVTQAQGIERMAERIGGRLEGVLTGMLDAHLLAIDASLHSARGRSTS